MNDKKLPPPELIWLYSHCKAIGMDCKSDSGKWEEDIALFTDNLRNTLIRCNAYAQQCRSAIVKWDRASTHEEIQEAEAALMRCLAVPKLESTL